MERAIVFTLPRVLTEAEEEYFVSAFQESVVKPTQKEINKHATKLSRGTYGNVMDATGANMIVTKLRTIAIDISAWMKLEKPTDRSYSFVYNIDALSAAVIDMPKVLQPMVGKKFVVGKFIPDKKIIRFFRGTVFKHLKIDPRDVRIENFKVD